MQAVIETPRLRLRPRVLGDADACYRMNMEPGTLAYVDPPETVGDWNDEAAHRAFIRVSTTHLYPDGFGYWTVTPREAPRRFLGWVLLIPEDMKGPEIETGWRFRTEARGQGFATEASRAILDHGFRQLGCDRVVADIYRQNAASVNVVRKLGFHEAGLPDRPTDTYTRWEITREMWAAPPS
ncbi:GNAT family N-acetyltransferase [Rhodobacteraceae bacterium NNCM2]|nr:GNAT family N-acetyltransferase [Coraliihabitans acroporae]